MKNINILLEQFRAELLNEAADLTSGASVLRALDRGQIPGIKKKVFLEGIPNEAGLLKERLNIYIKTIIEKVGENNLNKYLMLLLKKSGRAKSLFKFNVSDLNEMLDGFMAYFNNINKKEAKEKYKEKFEEFYNSPLNKNSVKLFEIWANDAFVEKSKMKDDDFEEIYNKNGWRVIVPKTYSAANKFACMNNRKSKWCTAASSRMFKHYTEKDNKLFIIRNEKADKMFQMDFGKDGYPNFMNEADLPAKISEVKSVIPDEVLKAIKNKDEKSAFDLIKAGSADPMKSEKLEKEKTKGDMGGWNEYVFDNLRELLDEIKDFDYPSFIKELKINTAAEALKVASGKKNGENNIKTIGRLTKGNKIYYYVITGDKKITLKYSSSSKEIGSFVLQKIGNKLVVKTFKSIMSSDIPNKIKNKLIDKHRPNYKAWELQGKSEEEIKKIKADDDKKYNDEEIFPTKKNTKTPYWSSGEYEIYTDFSSLAGLFGLPGMKESKVSEAKSFIYKNGGPRNILFAVRNKSESFFIYFKNAEITVISNSNYGSNFNREKGISQMRGDVYFKALELILKANVNNSRNLLEKKDLDIIKGAGKGSYKKIMKINKHIDLTSINKLMFEIKNKEGKLLTKNTASYYDSVNGYINTIRELGSEELYGIKLENVSKEIEDKVKAIKAVV